MANAGPNTNGSQVSQHINAMWQHYAGVAVCCQYQWLYRLRQLFLVFAVLPVHSQDCLVGWQARCLWQCDQRNGYCAKGGVIWQLQWQDQQAHHCR